ncbi:hypothetical protein [Streptomyces formicae]|uniref:Secreted protein n=1 Tax=Streptomyces formicae TaxID=1616117 RepID=A0A291QER8_9ACTN|nr:hypothetical protein [Streptomyces formicae]ATL30058.1 hypothetical protein KY5_5040 [Streptomyces formicae]
MARNTASNSPRPGVRALLRVGLTVTAAGAALGAGGAANASAAEPVAAAPTAGFATPVGDVDAGAPGKAVLDAVRRSTAGGLAPAKALRLNPLAGTGVDPLDNSLGTQIADFKPISTAAVTAPLTEGAALQDLPVVGPATGLLPG